MRIAHGAKIALARVHLWDELVGALAYSESSGLCTFEYAEKWLQQGIEISPLRLPLRPGKFVFPALSRDTYKGLPAAFADTLPDDFGNAVIDAWLAREGRDSHAFSALERLLYTGKRGMGALEYLPSTIPALDISQNVQLSSLVSMAQTVLDQRAKLEVNLKDEALKDEALMAMMLVGTSAGGARAKAVIGINAERSQVRSGQLSLPEGFEHYLLKFDGVCERSSSQETFGDPLGFGRMEYAYYLMAVEAGIAISHSELLSDGDRAHFITKRFDRDHNRKIHYQSLCAMEHADYKKPGGYSYEQLFQTMRRLRLHRPAALEMFRRMAFNVIARNHDDHTKNFGFILKQGGSWELAPAFDLAFSYKKGSPWVHAHQLSLNGKREDFVREDLLAVVPSFRKEAALIIEEITEVVTDWKRFADLASVDSGFATYIGAHHRLAL